MKQYPDKYFDLAIVDPPYGINIGGTIEGAKPFGSQVMRVGGEKCATPKTYKAFDDSHPPEAEYFEELKRVAKNIIIWGGNYFLDYLNATECFIVWDKKRRGTNFADCELAWTNIKQPCRIVEYRWNGMLQENMKEKEIRIHPTQKPVELYRRLLKDYATPGDIILDTHVGSASSLIACEELGFDYVGFEIDKEYYQKARARIDEFNQQIRMF